jgi:hypothetical protein
MKAIYKVWCVPAAACAALLAGCSAAASGAEKAPPKGYAVVRPDRGAGEVLIATVKDAASSRAVLAGALKDLTAYFDDGPKVLGAVGSENDVKAEATFAAKRGDTVVEGMIVVHVGDRDAAVGVAYDRPEAFEKNKADLAALVEKHMPPTPAAPKVELTAQPLPDGSGTIAVPAGWQVNAANGAADVHGPGMVGGVFGLSCTVLTPAGADAIRRTGVEPSGSPIAKRSDPASVLQATSPAFYAAQGVGWKWKELLGETKADLPLLGDARFLLYDADYTVGGKTTTVRSLAFVYVMPDVGGQYGLYISAVAAPADEFAQRLPTLLAVWKSWKTDDKVFQARLAHAAQTMKETARMAQAVVAERQRVMDRAMDDWSEVIRGTSQVLDHKYDTIKEVDSYELDKIVRGLNEHEGSERWKIIPLKDLRNP